MANKIGQLLCAADSKNTGFGTCFEDPKQIIGAFIFDSPASFTPQQIQVLQATMAAAASADSKVMRMYPLHNFLAITDNSENVIVETFDYGAKAIVRDGDVDWVFQFTDGGNCKQQALRTHNGPKYFMFYDVNNTLYGYNNSGKLAAIPTHYIYAHPWKPATGSKTAQYMMEFEFLPKYVNEERAFVRAGFDLASILGLQDIDILVNSFNQNSGVANVTLQTDCGAENVFDQYSTDIVAASFNAVDQDGNDVGITSVAPVSSSKTFNITLDTADFPDNGTVTLSGAPISDLVTQLIIGYEIGHVDLEVVGS